MRNILFVAGERGGGGILETKPGDPRGLQRPNSWL